MAEELRADGKRKVQLGRDVHYVLDDGPSVGECRPAKVVKVWDNDFNQCVQLQVFTDGSNDGFSEGLVWKTSVEHNDTGVAYSWHWDDECKGETS